jgi:hypothetical protein
VGVAVEKAVGLERQRDVTTCAFSLFISSQSECSSLM